MPTPAVSLCFKVSDTAVKTLGQSHYISVSIARDLKQCTQVPQGKYASFRLYDALALLNAAGAVVDPVAGSLAVIAGAGRGLNTGSDASDGGRNVLNCRRKATYQEQIP